MPPLHVVMVAGECVPFAKVGGLGDVVGALPLALEKLGVTVTVVIPRHRVIDLHKYGFERYPARAEDSIPLGLERIPYDVHRGKMPRSSIEVFLIGNDRFFDRDGIYVDVATARDYPDQADRWIFFQRAAMEFLKARFPSLDILHCHDHQTGLMPAYLSKLYRSDSAFTNTRSIFTIHNMGYQGLFPREAMTRTGFNDAEFYPTSPFEFYGLLNFMKVGITYSDLITTVSPTYAREIQESREFGYGLEDVLRARSSSLIGILNGIDDSLWNPQTDNLIAATYSPADLSGKLENKKALLKKFELDATHLDWPVLAMISRIDVQKGFDLLVSILDHLLSKDLYFALNRYLSLPSSWAASVRYRLDRPGRAGGYCVHLGCGFKYLDGMINTDGNVFRKIDLWLDSYIGDFLTRARERGFAVSDTAFKLALDRLRNFVANAQDLAKDGGRNLAYALYVLARNGAAPIGDLRYYADTKLDAIATPIAKAQIAAALGMLGDRARAERVYAAALTSIAPRPVLDYGRTDYGSVLRDAAALVTLASEGAAPRATVLGAVERVEAARGLTRYTSTQENAWMVLAARALAKDAQTVALDVGGEKTQGAFNRSLRASDLQQPLKVTNAGDAAVQAVVTVSGAPLVPEPAAENGFKIERKYYTLDGKPADARKAKQNDRFAVVLKITEPQPQFGRIIVADYLPAGFEIDNPRLVSSGDTGTLAWITDAQQPVNAEFRDDRFSAAFERKSDDASVFTVVYVVRAVSPGRYVHPQAYVEDMYRPDRFGRTATGTVEVTK